MRADREGRAGIAGRAGSRDRQGRHEKQWTKKCSVCVINMATILRNFREVASTLKRTLY